MIAALDAFAQLSGHPELTAAPLLLAGSSLDGCIAHDFTRIHHARVLGFMTAKGNCHLGGVSPGRLVPGYLFVAEEDPVSPDAMVAITQLFVTNRAEGALWSLMIDPPGGSHRWPPHHDLTIGWMDAVLSARLPLPGQTALRSVTEGAGWLGDRSSFQVGPFACYGAGKQDASWLPTEATARSWQQLSSGNAVATVRSCPYLCRSASSAAVRSLSTHAAPAEAAGCDRQCAERLYPRFQPPRATSIQPRVLPVHPSG